MIIEFLLTGGRGRAGGEERTGTAAALATNQFRYGTQPVDCRCKSVNVDVAVSDLNPNT